MSRVVVLGGGESGVGSAVLAKVKGFDVFLSDMGRITDEYAAMLEKWEIPYEQGMHTEELILNADGTSKTWAEIAEDNEKYEYNYQKLVEDENGNMLKDTVDTIIYDIGTTENPLIKQYLEFKDLFLLYTLYI